MSDSTGVVDGRFHHFRVFKRRDHGDVEIIYDFPRVGVNELQFLLSQHKGLSREYVIEVDGEELTRDEALRPLSAMTSARFGDDALRATTLYATGAATRAERSAPTQITSRIVSAQEDAEVRIWGTYERLIFAAEESMRRTQRLTEMTVAQHEYMNEELRRLRATYEEEFAAERKILRQLRAAWLERVCDDEIHIEDIARFISEQFGSRKKTDDTKDEATENEAEVDSEPASPERSAP
jgi:hypothetical protein